MSHAVGRAMTCEECLRLVATAHVAELTTAGAVTEHCRACVDCAEVIDAVAEETRRLADTLDGTLPGVQSHVVALRAVADAARGRRRAGRLRTAWYASAAVVALLAAVMAHRAAVPQPPVAGAALVLRCLGFEDAVDLAGHRISPAVMVRLRRGSRVVTLRGPQDAVAQAERILTQLDDEHARRGTLCAATPHPTAPHATAGPVHVRPAP